MPLQFHHLHWYMFYYHSVETKASSLQLIELLLTDLQSLCYRIEAPCSVFQMDTFHYEHE